MTGTTRGSIYGCVFVPLSPVFYYGDIVTTNRPSTGTDQQASISPGVAVDAAPSGRFWRIGLLLPTSFAAMILVGTLLLRLPSATPAYVELTWLDALFTATSAVCVTGLLVHDTATQFTPLGQTIIGLLIQLGGLSIMIFAAMIATALVPRRRISEDDNPLEKSNDQPLRRARALVLFVVVTTISIELAGAAAMMPMWQGDVSWSQRVGLSLFHSVSAFCNAGFTLFSDNLRSYRYSMLSHLVVVPLLVIGGLGFGVLNNLWRMARGRNTADRRMTLHTKIVLTTTAGLYVLGVAVIAAQQLMPYVYERLDLNVTANRQEMAPLNLKILGRTLADASFMSWSARTGGFNTMPMEDTRAAGQLTLMALMMVGGSPGGTAGGIRTTTLAILLLSIFAAARKRGDAEVFGRRIADTFVRQAMVIAAYYLILIVLMTMLLGLSESFPLNKLLFEVTSAVSLTGLSMGITSDLTAFGKVVIITSMFLGRVGLLVLLSLMYSHHRLPRPNRLPREDVMMG